MPLAGFPDIIDVTLGDLWIGKHGLSPGVTLSLTKNEGPSFLGSPYWSEDGSGTPHNSNNRLKFNPHDFGASYGGESHKVYLEGADTGMSGWMLVMFTTLFVGTPYNPGTPDGQYGFKEVWTENPSFADVLGGQYYGFTDGYGLYNPNIFSAMAEGGGGGGDPGGGGGDAANAGFFAGGLI